LSAPAHAESQSGISGILSAGTTPELVQENFQFTEGPVGRADGSLLFTDIRVNRIYELDLTGRAAVFRTGTKSANGSALMRTGELLAAEGDGKRIVKSTGSDWNVVVSQSADRKALLAPNDLILDAKGGLYFTDPGPRPVVSGRKAYVYYLPVGASVPVPLDDQLTRPNGLTLTLDGRTLIVDDTVGDTIYAFDLQSDGTVKRKRPFAQLHDVVAGQESGADGMAIDSDGRVYVTSATGVQVFDSAGHYLGTIKLPRQPANVALAGPDKRTLYITAREGLYRLKMYPRARSVLASRRQLRPGPPPCTNSVQHLRHRLDPLRLSFR
jgi:gluconolactonase